MGYIQVIKEVISGDRIISISDRKELEEFEDMLHWAGMIHPSHKLSSFSGISFPAYFKFIQSNISKKLEPVRGEVVYAPVFELWSIPIEAVDLSKAPFEMPFNNRYIRPVLPILGQYVNLERMKGNDMCKHLPINETWEETLELFCILRQAEEILLNSVFNTVCLAIIKGTGEYLPKVTPDISEIPDRWNHIMTQFLVPYAEVLKISWDELQKDKAEQEKLNDKGEKND